MTSDIDDNVPLCEKSLENEDDDELSGCGGTLPCDPRRRLHRYLMLFFICFLSFGSYFCYDNPASMQDIMLTELHLTSTEFMGFYAWYSWPNVVLSFVGGFLIDRVFGIRLGAIIFGSFVFFGQLLFASGALVSQLWLMDAARFVFGIGGESLAVAQNTYATSWFLDTELNLIFGLQLSISRVGSTVNMNTMQPIFNSLPTSWTGSRRLGISLFIAAITCVFSLGCALILAYFDRRAKRILKKDAGATGEVIRLTDIRYFPAGFWFICIICVAYYVAVFPFISLGLVFFERKYDQTATSAAVVNSLVYIVSAIASPLMGFMIDVTGKNIFWVLAGILCTLGCHALFAFSFLTPYAVMVLLGISYSILASSLWPMVAFVLPPHQRGTAYGIMQSVQNLGLGVVALVAGALVDVKGYLILLVFFMMCLCVALLFCVLLYLWDASYDGKLNEWGHVRRSRQVHSGDLSVST